jgi:hypothetical protein
MIPAISIHSSLEKDFAWFNEMKFFNISVGLFYGLQLMMPNTIWPYLIQTFIFLSAWLILYLLSNMIYEFSKNNQQREN